MMVSLLKIAARNLLRYRRRTLLTALLITVGIVAVLTFISVAESFRGLMVGQITDSMLGHVQIHRKGYVASVDNLPLNLNMNPNMVTKIRDILGGLDETESFSPRVKFGAMFGNFKETTNIRLNAVDPKHEAATVPLLTKRIVKGGVEDGLVAKGKILVPELIAKGMKVKLSDTIVLVATNQDGSVNGRTLKVQGVLEGISGPGGRDGYIHVDDARALLRMKQPDVSEIAVRLLHVGSTDATTNELQTALSGITNKMGKPMFEVHAWQKLTPFSNIAKMIDLLTLFIQIMLIAIVLISIMNVMVMAVFERVREIGAIAAIGTQPRRILALFVSEGLLLGVVGTVAGAILSLGIIKILNVAEISFEFGRQKGLILQPTIDLSTVATVCVIVIAIAVLASLQPAWKAARMDPIVALRHV
jgi:putative ABC transport system permease protein